MSDYVHLGTQYGPMVVGKEEAARQAAIRELTSGQTYGSLVLGEDRAAELRALEARGEIRDDEIPQPPPAAVVDPISAPPNAGDAAPVPPIQPAEKLPVPSYTLAQVSAILADQKHMLDALVEAEMARPEGPRKGAVSMFVGVAKELGRDPEFVSALEALVE